MKKEEFIKKIITLFESDPALMNRLLASPAPAAFPNMIDRYLARADEYKIFLLDDDYCDEILKILRKTFTFLEQKLLNEKDFMPLFGIVAQAILLTYYLPSANDKPYNSETFWLLYKVAVSESEESEEITQAQWNQWQIKMLWSQGIIDSIDFKTNSFPDDLPSLRPNFTQVVIIAPAPKVIRFSAPVATTAPTLPPLHEHATNVPLLQHPVKHGRLFSDYKLEASPEVIETPEHAQYTAAPHCKRAKTDT